MRLTAVRGAHVADLEQAVGTVLDRRLLTGCERPVAVALSGGGDSVALLLTAAEWAKRAGRGLVVLTVDHRLRPQSAEWTQACAATAGRLALPFRALAWDGAKPVTGLPAAARAARHRLLADAARGAGARVILMGHTADDRLEARLMREAGSTTPDPREWAPSPAWPEGRGVFLLRPLLDVRRADIRAWLDARGERWIEDPANADVAYARPRARQALARGAEPSVGAQARSARDLCLASRPRSDGGFEVGRASLLAADASALKRFLSAACLCAAGTQRPPRSDSLARLAARIEAGAPFAASLAGARVEVEAIQVRFLREPGEAARGGLAPLRLQAGETAVWDGRFDVSVSRAATIQATPRTARPMAIGDDGEPAPLEASAITWDRLLAACGAIEREPA